MSTNILFVCLGNICRSPMAEFIAKDYIKKLNLELQYQIMSAGTANYHQGENMHYGTFNLLKDKKIDNQGFHSKQINQDLYDWADVIFVMDEQNLKDVNRKFGKNNKTELITNWSSTPSIRKVPDPWYTNNFNEVYDILSDCLNNYFKK